MAIDYKNSLGRYRRYLNNMQSQPLWNASFWVSLTIVLVILMVIFFLRPTLVIISGLMGRVREQNALLVRMDAKLEVLRQAQENYIQTSTGQEILNQALPENAQWKEMADNLYLIASNSGAIIKKIQVGNVLVQGEKIVENNQNRNVESAQEKLPKGVEKVEFVFEVDGEYSQIKDCLTKIETVGRLLVINNARINKNKDESLGLSVDGYAAFFKYMKDNP